MLSLAEALAIFIWNETRFCYFMPLFVPHVMFSKRKLTSREEIKDLNPSEMWLDFCFWLVSRRLCRTNTSPENILFLVIKVQNGIVSYYPASAELSTSKANGKWLSSWTRAGKSNMLMLSTEIGKIKGSQVWNPTEIVSPYESRFGRNPIQIELAQWDKSLLYCNNICCISSHQNIMDTWFT